jgi:hypothetical protein
MMAKYHHVLSIDQGDIGTHSLRKGSATYAGGLVDGPSAISIHLRAGWSLGGVQDRYFRWERAGDQFVGRVTSGLSPRTADFAALPPHFYKFDEEIMAVAKAQFPTVTAPLSLFLLSSLVFHREFLIANLKSSHPLFSTVVFCSTDQLVNKLAGKEQPMPTLRATGVPSHVDILSGIKNIEENVKETPSIIRSAIQNANYQQSPYITKEYLESALETALGRFAISASRENEPAASLPSFSPYCWKGNFHRLPEHYTLPKVPVRIAFIVWTQGDSPSSIPPIRSCNPSDFSSHSERKVFSEWGYVFRTLDAVGDPSTTQNILQKVKEVCARTSSGRVRRVEQLKICSIAKIIRKTRKV